MKCVVGVTAVVNTFTSTVITGSRVNPQQERLKQLFIKALPVKVTIGPLLTYVYKGLLNPTAVFTRLLHNSTMTFCSIVCECVSPAKFLNLESSTDHWHSDVFLVQESLVLSHGTISSGSRAIQQQVLYM